MLAIDGFLIRAFIGPALRPVIRAMPIRPMKLVLQRVDRSHVVVDQRVTGAIDHGLLVLVGLGHGDDERLFPKMLDKMLNLRIFADAAGGMNRSVVDVSGGVLLVPQFTLYADCRKGRRPSFTDAMPPDAARVLFERFVEATRVAYNAGHVAAGEFGAHMSVELINDGPVTILLDSAQLAVP